MPESYRGERQLLNFTHGWHENQSVWKRGKWGPWQYEIMGRFFCKPRICLKWSWNTKLQVDKTYTFYLSLMICFFKLLLWTFIIGILYEKTGSSPGYCRSGSRLKPLCINMVDDVVNQASAVHWCLRHAWNWEYYSVNLISTEIRYFYWQ